MPLAVLCPTCGAKLQIPDASVGGNVACPMCSAEMAIPHPPGGAPGAPLPAAPPIFASPVASRTTRGPTVLGAAVRRDTDADDDDRPARRKSSRRSRRDDYEDDEDGGGRVRRSSRGFQCPYCASRSFPVTRTKISQGGWVVFTLMILFCLPLFFIGLLMTEEYRVCADCGIKIGG